MWLQNDRDFRVFITDLPILRTHFIEENKFNQLSMHSEVRDFLLSMVVE